MGAVRDRGVDLYAAIQGARDALRSRPASRLRSDVSVRAVEVKILVRAGQQRPLHAFALQAQHDDHVGVRDTAGEVGETHVHPWIRYSAVSRSWVPPPGSLGTQGTQGVDLRPGDPRVLDVAHDGDL